MLIKTQTLLKPPVFADEEQTRVAGLLHVVSLTLLVALGLTAIAGAFLGNPRVAEALAAGMLGPLASLWLTHRGRLRAAGLASLLVILVILNYFLYRADGLHDIATLAYPALIVVASLLLDKPTFIAYVALLIFSLQAIIYGELRGLVVSRFSHYTLPADFVYATAIMGVTAIVARLLADNITRNIARTRASQEALAERNYDLTHAAEESQRLNEQLQTEIVERQQAEAALQTQLQIIQSQQQTLRELSSPVIPVMDAHDGAGGIIVLPLIGGIDSQRAQDIMRSVLTGIREHHAAYLILDITGVPLMNTGIINYLNKTIQAARLKGARVIVTGISDAVAESIVDLGVDWGNVQTLANLQSGLHVALERMGIVLQPR
jgi:anti-anti-sigma regulatory factor